MSKSEKNPEKRVKLKDFIANRLDARRKFYETKNKVDDIYYDLQEAADLSFCGEERYSEREIDRFRKVADKALTFYRGALLEEHDEETSLAKCFWENTFNYEAPHAILPRSLISILVIVMITFSICLYVPLLYSHASLLNLLPDSFFDYPALGLLAVTLPVAPAVVCVFCVGQGLVDSICSCAIKKRIENISYYLDDIACRDFARFVEL